MSSTPLFSARIVSAADDAGLDPEFCNEYFEDRILGKIVRCSRLKHDSKNHFGAPNPQAWDAHVRVRLG